MKPVERRSSRQLYGWVSNNSKLEVDIMRNNINGNGGPPNGFPDVGGGGQSDGFSGIGGGGQDAFPGIGGGGTPPPAIGGGGTPGTLDGGGGQTDNI
jgi:hypothetical protein